MAGLRWEFRNPYLKSSLVFLGRLILNLRLLQITKMEEEEGR